MNNSIFKDLVVIDNALDDPYELMSKSRDINFFTNESIPLQGFNLNVTGEKPSGIWAGYRSEPLHKVDSDLFEKTITELLTKVINVPNYRYVASSFLHISDGSITNTEAWWHTDTNVLFAGVLYLNQTPEPNSGTIIVTDQGEQIIENKFNRFVFYRSDLKHRPQGMFGDNFFNSRLTLNLFVEKLQMSI
jgi:hypothetical protein